MVQETGKVSKRRETALTVAVLAAVILVLALAIVVQRGNQLDVAVEFLSRWFFAVFCTAYALAQARVYFLRKSQQVRVAMDMPVSPFGFFTVLWFALAVASVVYGVRGGDGWLEVAAWITIVLVICVQQLVLGRLQRRSS